MPRTKRPALVAILTFIFFARMGVPAGLGAANAACSAPSPSAATQTEDLLKAKDPNLLRSVYRYAPVLLARNAEPGRIFDLYDRAQATDLKAALVLGMADTGNREVYANFLLDQFQRETPAVREAMATALGRLGEPRAAVLFERYLDDRVNWFGNGQATEAVLVAYGKVTREPKTRIFEQMMQEFPAYVAAGLAIHFGNFPDKDRLAGGLAWAYGDFKLNPNFAGTRYPFLETVFQTQSPRSSIMAAKSLLQWQGSAAAKEYLVNLLNNPVVKPDLRMLVGKALGAAAGGKAVTHYHAATAEGLSALLVMAQEVPKGEVPRTELKVLFDTKDDPIWAEAALHLAKNGLPADLDEIERRARQTPGPLSKAALAYAWEAIACR